MPRGAQVIYPKDLGAILIAADIAPGQRVLEAGVGSGALSMTVLRAGASIVGYELREDFAERARANVAATLGPDAPYRVEIRDVTEGIDESGLDRILLDMPEPHKVVTGAAAALRPGGILLAYLPTINQTALLRQVLDEEGVALRTGRDAGDHAPNLARRGALGPSRPPHGRPHRLPHDGAASGGLNVDEGVAGYIGAIAPEQRPLFDRLHAIVLAEHPDAEVVLSYGMPAYRVGGRRLNLGRVEARRVRLRLADRPRRRLRRPPPPAFEWQGDDPDPAGGCRGDLRRRAAGAPGRRARTLMRRVASRAR